MILITIKPKPYLDSYNIVELNACIKTIKYAEIRFQFFKEGHIKSMVYILEHAGVTYLGSSVEGEFSPTISNISGPYKIYKDGRMLYRCGDSDVKSERHFTDVKLLYSENIRALFESNEL